MPNNNIDKLISDIANYIDFLNQSKSYFITFHFHDERFIYLMSKITRFNIHNSTYCAIIKSNIDIRRRCIICQNKIMKRYSDEPFFGICHSGVEEYVFPLVLEKIIGFISVSGYRSNSKEATTRVKKVAQDLCISEDVMMNSYMENLNPIIPSFDEVKTVVYPLCHMLIYLCTQVVEIYNGISDIGSKNCDDVYQAIIWYIENRFSSKITISDIADYCKCSTSYISHIFKKRNGHSIIYYLTNIRIEKSKKFLKNTQFSIQEICNMVGFSDASYFTTTFKKRCGISPSTYRDML